MSGRWPTISGSPVSEELRRRWRQAGYWTDERLGDLLERSATAWPDRVAVHTAEREHTFAEVQAESSAVARTLLDAGIRPGDVVSWVLPTAPVAIAVAAAVWRIGAVSSPIVPINRVAEMTNIFGQVRPRAVIAVPEFRGRDLAGEVEAALAAADVRNAVLLAAGDPPAGWRAVTESGPGSIPSGLEPTHPHEPCLILFTSGTESLPKAVLHSPAAIHHELRTTITEWGVTFRDRMFMASPLTHITGLLQGFMIPSRVGASAVLMERWDGEEAVDLIERTRATYMAGAMPFLRDLVTAYEKSGLDRSSLHQYCCGGAAVDPRFIEKAAELGVHAYRAWGMTELPTSTLANELDPLELRANADGRLAPGIELRVLDDDGTPVPPGTVGEFQLRGPEMMLGYVLPEHHEKAFTRDGWLTTGDVGWIGEDGWVRVTGRLKEIINRGGEKFSTREIETAVLRHPDVADVAVIGVPDERLGERIGAAVVTSRPDLGLDDLKRIVLATGLSKSKQPEVVVTVPELPRTATGKVDRRRLLELFDQGSGQH